MTDAKSSGKGGDRVEKIQAARNPRTHECERKGNEMRTGAGAGDAMVGEKIYPNNPCPFPERARIIWINLFANHRVARTRTGSHLIALPLAFVSPWIASGLYLFNPITTFAG